MVLSNHKGRPIAPLIGLIVRPVEFAAADARIADFGPRGRLMINGEWERGREQSPRVSFITDDTAVI